MEVSPTKRRVLGSLDLNALSSKPPSSPKQTKPDHHKPPNALQSPIKQPTGLQPSTDPRKRPLATEGQKEQQQSAKRICAGDDKVQDKQENKVRPAIKSPRLSESRRSESPTTLSLFDTSGIDNTHSTAITDLEAADADADTAALAPNPATALPTPIVTFSSADPPCLPSTRPRLTREQTREKAEILRLRLGLASYKVRTGQTDVPLEQLQVRPLPGASPRTATAAAGKSTQAQTHILRADSIASRLLAVNGTDASRSSQGKSSRETSRRGTSGKDRGGEQGRLSPSPPPLAPGPEPESDSEADDPITNADPELDPELERLSLPRLPLNTPRRGRFLAVEDGAEAERLTSSALRGGAANGLLSLARG